ncbi:MAG: glycosyltransferase family 2 protein [Chitinophagaceae bacterium]|nr:MAG: glycosyltransferase family 2 protein [Chitinophagaceae bacterium]
MKINPKVSVLIPTYNYARYLPEAIESVLNQTFTDFELIIVDNNSNDDTDEVVSRYKQDPRVSYYKNATNIGLAGNWNRCLELATGQYIKFLCADDKFHPLMLMKFTTVMDANPSVSLVTCHKQVFDAHSFVTTVAFSHLQDGRKALLNTLADHCWIGEPSSVMFRKKDLAVGNFTTVYQMHVDWEMWLRVLSVGDCYIVPEALSYIRYHPAQHARKMKKQKYVLCFEEYQLAKNVQLSNNFDYKIEPGNPVIKEAVKKRATFCVRHAMYKVIPRLYQRSAWPVFRKALKIGWQERVFGAALIELLKGLKINTIKLISAK